MYSVQFFNLILCNIRKKQLFNLLFTTKHLPKLLWIIQLSCYFLYTNQTKAQVLNTSKQDSATVFIKKDSSFLDSQKTFRISKDAIEETIDYSAEDSCIFDIQLKKAFLYGNAAVKYEGMDLKANYIVVDFNKKELFAKGSLDSNGRYVGKPLFNDGERETQADTMIYNFNTKRGRTYGITMKEDDGYIICNKVFRDDDKSIYSDEGKYTTCNRTDHPHFYLKARNLKIIPNKKIIFGPANLVIEDIPTPLFLPFGMFPTKKGKRSGLIPFEYGASGNFGPFIRNIGYHLAISEKFDQSFTGDIYFRGSWRIASNSRYYTRYKYNGSLRIEASKYINAEREDPNYKQKNTRPFSITWQHNKDAKAKPGSSFSANVNIQKSNSALFNAQNASTIVTNEFGSSVSYSKALLNNKLNLTAGFIHRQNTQSKDFSVSLPNITLNMQRITPFSKPDAFGKYKWYKDFGVSYQLEFENRIDTKDSLFFSGKHIEEVFPFFKINSPVVLNQKDKFRVGILHSIPITLGSYKFLKNKFSFTPTINYREYWYLKTIRKEWNPSLKKVDTFYNNNFERASDYSAAANIGTQVFGTFQVESKKIKAIRHTIQPNVGFSYRPDYGLARYGYYDSVQTDTNPNRRQSIYSKFDEGIKGKPSRGASGLLNFSIGNNLQAKVLKKTDSTAKYENVTWLENLNMTGSYNFLADSQKLSLISFSAFTKLFNQLSLQASATLNPYTKNGLVYIDQLEILKSGRVGTWTNGQVSLTTGLNADMFRPVKSKDTSGLIKSEEDKQELNQMFLYPNGYIDFSMPWTLNINYSYNYSRLNYKTNHIHTFSFNGDVNITPKWKIGCNSGYDFQQKRIAYTQFEVSRLLHCWAMTFSWIPDGFRKSFTFSLRANSSVLQSLKVDKKRNWFDQ